MNHPPLGTADAVHRTLCVSTAHITHTTDAALLRAGTFLTDNLCPLPADPTDCSGHRFPTPDAQDREMLRYLRSTHPDLHAVVDAALHHHCTYIRIEPDAPVVGDLACYDWP